MDINYAEIEKQLEQFFFYCPKCNPGITQLEKKDMCCDFAANCALNLANQTRSTEDTNLVTNATNLSDICSGGTCKVYQPLTNLRKYVDLMKEQNPDMFEVVGAYPFQPFKAPPVLLSHELAEIMEALTSNTETLHEDTSTEGPFDRKPSSSLDDPPYHG